MTKVTYTTLPCVVCKKKSAVEVDAEGMRKWSDGAHIQHAFPTLSNQERELLMTGTHPECWDNLWKEEDE